MNLVKELLKQTEKIDFYFPNTFEQLMNDKYYDYDKFEWFLYYVFKLDGVSVQKVGQKGKGDGGADLILTVSQKDGSLYRIGIQAKYWKNRVGSAPVNQLASAKARHNLTHLWLITTSDLTSDAKEIAESLQIKVLRAEDVKDLISKVKEYYKKDLEENGESSIQFLPLKEKELKTPKPKTEKKVETIDETLFEKGKKLRTEIAKKYNLYPVYNVFNNKELETLLELKPKTKEELLKIKGFAEARVNKFGDDIIEFFKEIDSQVTYNEELYKLLIEERPKIAKFNKLKEEDVYSDRVATYLAKMMPKTKNDLKNIFGFKKENIDIFRDYLLRIINNFNS